MRTDDRDDLVGDVADALTLDQPVQWERCARLAAGADRAQIENLRVIERVLASRPVAGQASEAVQAPRAVHALIAIASLEVAATLLLLPWAWGDYYRVHGEVAVFMTTKFVGHAADAGLLLWAGRGDWRTWLLGVYSLLKATHAPLHMLPAFVLELPPPSEYAAYLQHLPADHWLLLAWYYVAPGVAVFLTGQFLISTSRIWFARMGVSLGLRSRLPAWPLSPTADGPAIVIGEVHHPVRAIESPTPEWLTIPERGLYTGVAIFGAVGSGKTSACMHPFARQLLSWQAGNPERRPAALVLEVKGDFCHDIRAILKDVDREGDYIELSLDGRLTWNPLSATWLDSYSLAYTVASLLNQLFGKGKEPFWQQAYTNLVRWIIELYRVLPHPQDGSATPGWVTLRDVYHCAIDKELFAAKIAEAQTFAADRGDQWITVDAREIRHDEAAMFALTAVGFLPHPTRPDRLRAHPDPPVFDHLNAHTITYERERFENATAMEIRLRVEAVNRWYVHDWNTLDNKIRSSIVEGISVFLSMFDLPSVARVFCPPAPGAASAGYDPGDPINEDDAITATIKTGDLPPLDVLIESGKVLALNMPAGTNPALARAVGVMLKNAWLQSLLRRPATMKADPGRYVRPAVFICDEYQAFASVGEDDPSGDEKAFALTRQCRVIPIVATQSISSLRSVLGSGEGWRTLLQTLRTRIFLSLSDEASAEMASKLCGQVAKIKSSYTINESAKSSGINLLSAQAGGGRSSVGASKSFQERREALFQPRDFALLGNCQAICLPYDGVQSLPPRRVYLKPHYLPADLPYWQAKRTGQL